MKRVVASSEVYPYTYEGKKFMIHDNSELYSYDGDYNIDIQITYSRPYDDADYVWAKADKDYIRFIQGRREIEEERIPLAWYEPDSGDFSDYIEYEIIPVACETLIDLNKDIQPRILHD